MAMLLLTLVIGVLAVMRITRLLVEDRLLLGYRRWAVNKWGNDSLPAYLAHCPWCTSIWVAIPVMPVAAIWPNKWVLAGLLIPAASMITGLVADRKE